MERRDFLRLMAVTAGAIGLASCGVPVNEPTPVPFGLRDYLDPNNEKARETLLGQMAELFISKTGYEGESPVLTANWQWGFSPEDREAFIQAHPKAPSDFNATTVTNLENDTRLTFVDLYRMRRLNNGQPLAQNGYTDEQRLLLIQAVILHEMERKVQGDIVYDPPIPVHNPGDSSRVVFEVQRSHGFDLLTTDNKVIGQLLDQAVAEGAAAVALDDSYFGGNPIDTPTALYADLNYLLTSLGIPWQTVFAYHRNGDVFGFGALVSDKLKYDGPDKQAMGILVADVVADGNREDITRLLEILHIDWSLPQSENEDSTIIVTNWPLRADIYQYSSSTFQTL